MNSATRYTYVTVVIRLPRVPRCPEAVDVLIGRINSSPAVQLEFKYEYVTTFVDEYHIVTLWIYLHVQLVRMSCISVSERGIVFGSEPHVERVCFQVDKVRAKSDVPRTIGSKDKIANEALLAFPASWIYGSAREASHTQEGTRGADAPYSRVLYPILSAYHYTSRYIVISLASSRLSELLCVSYYHMRHFYKSPYYTNPF